MISDATTLEQAHREDDRPIPIRPARHWSRWITGASAMAALIVLVWVVVDGSSIQWATVPEYLLNPKILEGVVATVQLTVVCMFLGILIGVLMAVMAMSASPVLRGLSTAYVWFFRGVPLLVQIIFWFNIALFVPEIGVGSVAWSTNSLVTSFVAAVLALSLHEGAYMAEIVRAGIGSVDDGQWTASTALGLRRSQAFRLVVLPQALRFIIPPTGNNFIVMLKDTSLVSVIAASELLTQAQAIYSRNYLIMELLMVISIWYLALTAIASIGQHFVERHYARDSSSRIAAAWRTVANLAPGAHPHSGNDWTKQ